MDLPNRKKNRLKGYDYASSGAYFVTICTKDKKHILSKIVSNIVFNNNFVGATSGRQNSIKLSKHGEIIENAICGITKYYPMVKVDKYVIMPNHIHLLLIIYGDNGRALHAPTISHLIQQFKGIVSKNAGFPIFQRSFHDHIIRNKHDYEMIWHYINTNP